MRTSLDTENPDNKDMPEVQVGILEYGESAESKEEGATMMKNIPSITRGVIGIIVVFGFVFGLAIILTLTVKTGYTTVIRVNTEADYEYVIAGDEPLITFVSLRDAPYDGDAVKILKVKYKVSWENMMRDGVFHSGDTVGKWLGDGNIRSYPELVRP